MPLWRRTRLPDDPAEVRMTLGEHLDELRRRLIVCLLATGATTVVCFLFRGTVFLFICRPYAVVMRHYGLPVRIAAMSPPETFVLALKLSFLCGIVLASPVVLHQIWAFVAAGLYPHERRPVQRAVPVSVGLFLAGVMFMFFIVLPPVLKYLVGTGQWVPTPYAEPNWLDRLLVGTPATQPATTGPVEMFVRPEYRLQWYVDFALRLSLGFGIGFQTPLVVVVIARTGIVSVQRMARARRYVIFIVVVAAAIFTPPDVVSQMLLAGPMIALFEVGLLIARRTQRREGGDERVA